MGYASDIDELFSQLKTAPVLFAGAGLSRRYLGSPDWRTLLKVFANSCRKSLNYYISSNDGDLAACGSHIASDFHEIWFNDSRFVESREQYESLCTHKSDPLKFEVSQILQDWTIKEEYLEEIELLRRAPFEAIITTNYDTFLESQFSDFHVYHTQDSLIVGKAFQSGEIFKIHGCVTDPSSLVLTTEDYERFNERNLIFTAKLLTLLTEHPILFVGYSVNDSNVQQMLLSLSSCVSNANLENLSNKLIFVEWQEGCNPSVQPTSFQIKDSSIPITRISCEDFREVFQALTRIERKIPVRVLRTIREQLFSLSYSVDVQRRVKVVGIENDHNLDNIEYVIGIGLPDITIQPTAVSYKSISLSDYCQLVLNDNFDNPMSLLQDVVIPSLKSKGWRHCPVFRLLKECDITIEKIEKGSPLEILREFAGKDQSNFVIKGYASKRAEVNAKFGTLHELYNPDDHKWLYSLALLEADKIDLPSLRSILVDNYESLNIKNAGALRLAICFYDYLMYKDG